MNTDPDRCRNSNDTFGSETARCEYSDGGGCAGVVDGVGHVEIPVLGDLLEEVPPTDAGVLKVKRFCVLGEKLLLVKDIVQRNLIEDELRRHVLVVDLESLVQPFGKRIVGGVEKLVGVCLFGGGLLDGRR